MSEPTLRVTINGKSTDVPAGTTVLTAATALGTFIPTLCYHQRLAPYGACRICMVELTPAGKDRGMMVTACTHPLTDGDQVRTESDAITAARRLILQLLLARSPQAKAVKALADRYGVDINPDSPDPFQAYLGAKTKTRADAAGEEGLTRCMLCGLCTRVCREVVGREAISLVARGPRRRVRPPFNDISPSCIGCGACAYICPNDAIKIERSAG
ncbi:MAG TPA: hypothetical protein DCS43_12480 [Verrucomicrobia bacterium]|nr:hypothetical protein [Verrucomicrobiota bacterium]